MYEGSIPSLVSDCINDYCDRIRNEYGDADCNEHCSLCSEDGKCFYNKSIDFVRKAYENLYE